jgi:hypothetical protein
VGATVTADELPVPVLRPAKTMWHPHAACVVVFRTPETTRLYRARAVKVGMVVALADGILRVRSAVGNHRYAPKPVSIPLSDVVRFATERERTLGAAAS